MIDFQLGFAPFLILLFFLVSLIGVFSSAARGRR